LRKRIHLSNRVSELIIREEIELGQVTPRPIEALDLRLVQAHPTDESLDDSFVRLSV
jgi:hypothetical protein